MVTPYDQGGWTSGMKIEGKDVEMEVNAVTDRFAEVMGLELVSGRWFEEADGALACDPIVIDQDLARTLYGGEDPVGRQFGKPDPVGAGRGASSAWCASSARAASSRPGPTSCSSGCGSTLRPGSTPQAILVRVRPGTPAAFEEELTTPPPGRRSRMVVRDQAAHRGARSPRSGSS